MPFPALSRLPFRFVLLLLVCLTAGHAWAELVWTPKTGWTIEGGAMARLNSVDTLDAVKMMNKARTAEEKKHNYTARKYYKRVAKNYPNSVFAPEAQYRLGNLNLARKRYVKAFESFQIVATQYPGTTRFNELIGKQYFIASSLLDGARTNIWGFIPGFTNREKSIQFFEVILIEAPYSDYAPLALMNVALAHQRFKNIEESIDALDRMINTYPTSLLSADAYLMLAQGHASLVAGSYYDQGSTRDAITYYEDYLILFPGDHNIGSAEKGLDDMKRTLADSKMKIADFYFYRRDNYKAARVFYNEAITVYPDSDIAVKARERLVKVEAAANKPPETKKKRFYFF